MNSTISVLRVISPALRPRLPVLLLGLLAGSACSPVTAVVAIDETPASLAIGVLPASPVDPVSTTDRLELVVGGNASLTALALNSLGNPVGTGAVTWTSLTPSVASVAADGSVTALAAGSTEIVAAMGGIEAVLLLVVAALE